VNHDETISQLTAAGMTRGRAAHLVDMAFRYGEWRAFGWTVTNTNSGMPAEYRIERV
jgi:hypothetical protein